MTGVPGEVEEIISQYNQSQVFYRALQAYPDWQGIGLSASGVLRIKGKANQRVYPVAYFKGSNGLIFGFWIQADYFKGPIFNVTDKDLAEEAGTKLLVSGQAADPVYKHPLQSLKMAPLFPEETLILAARKKGYYQERVRRDMLTSYGLIGLLILTFIVGIFLLHKYLSREAELVRMKSNFVDGVSHTLKTPLTRLSLLAEAVQEGCVEEQEKRERFFNTVISETMRMNEIINNMLNFSRVESGKKIYQPEPLLLQEVAASILKQLAATLKNLGFVLEKDIDMELPPVSLDREAARLIVLNLMQNALKYSIKEKYIRVRLARVESRIQLVVEDRGIGIDRDHLSRIFDKFYRDPDKQVQTLEGSGLGLFLVHHAVTAHHGEISVTSRPGKGSAFTISFPMGG
jgi:signal transduction histidine kinase